MAKLSRTACKSTRSGSISASGRTTITTELRPGHIGVPSRLPVSPAPSQSVQRV